MRIISKLLNKLYKRNDNYISGVLIRPIEREKVVLKDINGIQIKPGMTVRHFCNGEWRVEKVGWVYDSILGRRIWVYKPSGLSVRYSCMKHNGSMAQARDLTGKRLSPEVVKC